MVRYYWTENGETRRILRKEAIEKVGDPALRAAVRAMKKEGKENYRTQVGENTYLEISWV